jgi:hypothetical protein
MIAKETKIIAPAFITLTLMTPTLMIPASVNSTKMVASTLSINHLKNDTYISAPPKFLKPS